MPRILVLDDEPLIAAMVQEWLGELDCEVVGPANSVTGALGLLEAAPPDAAILDLSLGREESYPVADALTARGIPFAFLTGYGANGLAPRFKDNLVIAKPFDFKDVKSAVIQLLGGRSDA